MNSTEFDRRTSVIADIVTRRQAKIDKQERISKLTGPELNVYWESLTRFNSAVPAQS